MVCFGGGPVGHCEEVARENVSVLQNGGATFFSSHQHQAGRGNHASRIRTHDHIWGAGRSLGGQGRAFSWGTRER